jgi:hypothetical protein
MIVTIRFIIFCILSTNVEIIIYIIVMLPVVLYGCDTWSLTLIEYKLNMSEYRVLRGIFGSKREEVKDG